MQAIALVKSCLFFSILYTEHSFTKKKNVTILQTAKYDSFVSLEKECLCRMVDYYSSFVLRSYPNIFFGFFNLYFL